MLQTLQQKGLEQKGQSAKNFGLARTV